MTVRKEPIKKSEQCSSTVVYRNRSKRENIAVVKYWARPRCTQQSLRVNNSFIHGYKDQEVERRVEALSSAGSIILFLPVNNEQSIVLLFQDREWL